jgi:hypothetical protein
LEPETEESDYDGFLDGEDTLDDGFDHDDEYAWGFHEFDPEEETALEVTVSQRREDGLGKDARPSWAAAA